MLEDGEGERLKVLHAAHNKRAAKPTLGQTVAQGIESTRGGRGGDRTDGRAFVLVRGGEHCWVLWRAGCVHGHQICHRSTHVDDIRWPSPPDAAKSSQTSQYTTQFIPSFFSDAWGSAREAAPTGPSRFLLCSLSRELAVSTGERRPKVSIAHRGDQNESSTTRQLTGTPLCFVPTVRTVSVAWAGCEACSLNSPETVRHTPPTGTPSAESTTSRASHREPSRTPQVRNADAQQRSTTRQQMTRCAPARGVSCRALGRRMRSRRPVLDTQRPSQTRPPNLILASTPLFARSETHTGH